MAELALLQNENEILKKELEEKDENLILASHYGKTLLEQNAELYSKLEKNIQECDDKVEKLEQETYSLSMKLETEQRTVGVLMTEMEMLENMHADQVKASIQNQKSEMAELKRKESKSQMKIQSLEKEIEIYKEKVSQLEMLLKESVENYEDKCQSIFLQSGLSESTLEMENQMNSLHLDKQRMENQILDLKRHLNSANLKVSNKEVEVKGVMNELEEKECQVTTMFNAMEKLKNENEELQMEIDQMKFAETDPRKKGNSLFAELEDNRQVLEKRVISLTSKFSTVKKQCELKAQEIAKLKLHIASLFTRSANQTDLQYQQYLEDALASSKNQVNALSTKCQELEDKLKIEDDANSCGAHCVSKFANDSYLKHLYTEALAKVASLEEELRYSGFMKISLDDKNLQLRRKLHQCEGEVNSKRAQIIRLTVRIEELLNSNGGEPEKAELRKEAAVPVLIERFPVTKEEDKEECSSKPKCILKEKYIPVGKNPNISKKAELRKEAAVPVLIERFPVMKEEDKEECSSKPKCILKEKYIPVGKNPNISNDSIVESHSFSKQTDNLKDNLEKENKHPYYFRRSLQKPLYESNKVNFGLPEEKEKDETKLKQQTNPVKKPRKKLEAPHITVSKDTQEECKVQ